MLKIVLLAVALTFTGCGKFLDKFSRLDEGFTRVELQGDRNAVATMNGGVMVIFSREAGGDGGSAFGFTTTELAMGRTVVVPNGTYKVYAFGSEEGSNKLLEGQGKCGLGNGGGLMNLSGGSTTVSITMSAANCGFGTTSAFTDPEYSDSGTNFDTLTFKFCSTMANPCDLISGSTYRVRFRLSGGHAPDKDIFLPSEPDSLTSGCSMSPGGGQTTSNFLAFVGSEEMSPPAEVLVYNDPTCSGPIVGRISLDDGLRHYRNPASGSTIYLDASPSSNTTYLNLVFP